MNGTEIIGVVGYPDDMRILDSDGIEEIGAQIYELFQDIKYNREDNQLKRFQYRLSTLRGQSGSPVIRKKAQQTPIGTHCYGGADTNSASSIGDPSGNDYKAYISMFHTSYPTIRAANDVTFIRPYMPSPEPQIPSGEEANEEGFICAFKSVVGVVSKVGRVTLPLGFFNG